MLLAALAAAPTAASPIDVRQRFDPGPGEPTTVVLTLDACGGGFDAALLATLVRWRVPATVFVTGRWIARQPGAVRELLAHPQLFELENHGAAHRPAVVGQTVHGMPGAPDLAAVAREIDEGAAALQRVASRAPHWYRGAGALYDPGSLELIGQRGYRVAGYSLNADDGATATAATVAQRLRGVSAGDIVLAHLNKPAGGTAEGIAEALPTLLQRGVRFIKLSEAPGVQVLPAARQARERRPAAGPGAP